MAKSSGPKTRGGDASKAKRPEKKPDDLSDEALARKGISATSDAKEWMRRNRITPDDVREIGGGGFSDSKIEVSSNGYGITMNASHESLVRATRSLIKHGSGEPFIKNEYFRVKEGLTGRGIGRRMLQRQVLAAERLGIKSIITLAAGDLRGSFNGYYSWASLGYNGKVPSSFSSRYAGTAIGKAKTTQELFQIRGGSEAWKEHGSGLDMKFTVKRGSLGWKMLFDGRRRFE